MTLNTKIENYKTSIDNQLTVSRNNGDTKRVNELTELRNKAGQITAERMVPQPIPYHDKNDYLERQYRKNIQDNQQTVSGTQRPSSTPKNYNADIVEGKNANYMSYPGNERNLLTKKDAELLMTKRDAEQLKLELQDLKEEVRKSRNANMATTVVSNSGRGIFRRKKDRTRVIIDTTYTGSKMNFQAPEVKIIRDTIYIDRPVEKIVEQIIRDTITNTVEKNNTVTKVEEKTVFTDNERDLILSASPELVLFDVGSFMIKNIYFPRLISLSNKIKKYPDLKINIKGHTDNTGSAAKNKQLSENRADAVRVFMIRHGVKRENIILDALGSQDPFAENKTKSGKSQNRRVEVKIVE